MDVIEGIVWVCPVHLAIINLKLTVGRHPGWLDGRQVRPNDLSIWTLVGKVTVDWLICINTAFVRTGNQRAYLRDPNTRSGADIENLLGMPERGEIQLIVESKSHHMVARKD